MTRESNGTLRILIMFIGVMASMIFGGWGIYAHLDGRIARAMDKSYTKDAGIMLEDRIGEIRSDLKDINRKLDVIIGIKPAGSLDRDDDADAPRRHSAQRVRTP